MDRLNQAATQLRDLYRGLSPGARLVALGLLAVVAVSIGWILKAAPGREQYLLSGEIFSSGQLQAMEAAMAKAGLNEYEVEGNRIRVPRGKHATYLAAVADGDALPPGFNSYLEKAIANESVFSNRNDKETRLKVARQDELALILRSMRNIENASVLYDVKEVRSGLDRQQIMTATVSVKPTGNQPLDATQVTAIRNLVSGAIAGLKREEVTVADLNGRVYPGGKDADIGDPQDDPYYARQRMYEQSLERKILDSLVYVPGVVVQVSAELDPQVRHVQESVKPDPHTVTQRTRTQNTLQLMPPGPTALGPSQLSGPNQPPTAAPPRSQEVEVTDESTERAVGYSRVSTEKRGLTPTEVRVTVVVPSGYYEQVWQERNRDLTASRGSHAPRRELEVIQREVKTSIESAVAALLPPAAPGLAHAEQVTVATFQSLSAPPAAPPPALPSVVRNWVEEYWQLLAWMLLGAAGIFVLRALARPRNLQQPEPEPVAVPFRQKLARDEESFPVRRPGGPSLRDNVADAVREDPDTAASILRNWISSAG